MAQTEVQIPRDYNSWKAMITQQCGESLTPEFIESRLKVLNNASDPFTQRFHELYGDPYVKALISWFERAKNDMN